MAKNKKAYSKKQFPADFKRITKPDGTRVFVTGGKEYVSRRAYLESVKN